MADDNFFSRWSKRKAGVAEPLPAAPRMAAPAPAEISEIEAPIERPTLPADVPAPTLEDVRHLTRDSDYAPFVARNVSPAVKNAALKQLFTDPHFNVMDGLDTYTGDFNTPDPLPPGMLRQMVQSQLLGLFDDEDRQAALAADPPAQPPAAQAPNLPAPAPAHEDPDLQLQPDDDAGRCGTDACPGAHAGRPD